MKRYSNPLVLLGLTAWLAPAAAWAGVVKGPYLQNVRADGITIAAETDNGSACSVSWGEGLGLTAALVADGIHHEGTIEGLQPSTCYPYRLTCGAETSPEASFCTAPSAGEPFSLVVFGDTRSNHVMHADVIRAIAAEGVDFFINTGDLVADGGLEEDWAPFFEVEGELLREVPMFPVVGNHDEDGGDIDIYSRLFAVPSGSSGSERYYAFTYGNARFIALDNQSIALGRPEDHTDQGDWFAAELARTAADPDIEHTFVFVHANMYSADDSRTGDEGLRLWRDAMLEHGVDFVFSGHDHHYARGQADNGLGFVVTGGGAGLYDFREGFETEGDPIEVAVWGWLPEPGDKPFTLHWTRKVHHYIRIDIQGPLFSACTKEVPGGMDGPGVSFDCFSYGEDDPDDPGDPDDGPSGSGCGCATGCAPSTGGLLLLVCLAPLVRRRYRL